MIQRVIDVLTRYSDEERPIGRYKVVDLSRFAYTGESFVGLEIGGVTRQSIYRDGRKPTLNTYLHAVKMDAGHSGYLALPLPRRKVPPLIVAGFDRFTGEQVILGRRNDNTWEVRGPNPYQSNSFTLLTHIQRQVQRDGTVFHLLFAYDDWAPGEGGKSGLGTNAFVSFDDGASWTAAPGPFQGMIDAVYQVWQWSGSTRTDGQGEGWFYLVAGGNTLKVCTMTFFPPVGTGQINNTRPAPTLLDSAGLKLDIPINGTANRIGGISDRSLSSGGLNYYTSHMLTASGIAVAQFTTNNAAPTANPAGTGTNGAVSYPGAAALPWEGLHATANQGDGSSVAGQERGTTSFEVKGSGVYSVRVDFTSPFGHNVIMSGPTLRQAVGVAIGMAVPTYLLTNPPLGLPQRATLLHGNMYRSDRRLVYTSTSPSAVGFGMTGLLTGSEDVFQGVPPNINGAFPSGDGVENGSTFRLAAAFPGPLPGEGSNPSYTATRLIAMVLYGSTVVLEDETDLLDIDEAHYTTQARTSVCATLQSTGAHWWSLLP